MKPRRLLFGACLLLLILAAAVWREVLAAPERELRVTFLDVGQGDAILIQGPTGVDLLIDGGPDRSVLRQLPRTLGFFDRTIDLVIETHPDKDHIAGLVGVFDRYRVRYFLSPGIPNDTSFALALDERAAKEKGAREFRARRGMRLHLGGGAYADVLYPGRDVSQGKTNDGSVAVRVVYGETSFMLAGDLSSPQEDAIAITYGAAIESDVLKASHHGSRHSTSEQWLAAVDPSTAVISAGKGNSYGHPAPEVVERLNASGARVVSTIDSGTLTFVSDGSSLELR